MPLVSGSNIHKPQPMIGPLLYANIAANEIAPSAEGGTKVLTKQPIRKQRFTNDTHRCLTTVGKSSMLYRLKIRMAARIHSFPKRANVITNTASQLYFAMSRDRKQAVPLRNRARMLIGRRLRPINGTRRMGASDRPEKNWAE